MPGSIACCDTCGEPLISTFIWSGCEWYCMRCKRAGEFFGFGICYRPASEVASRHEQLELAFKRAIDSASVALPDAERLAAMQASTLAIDIESVGAGAGE